MSDEKKQSSRRARVGSRAIAAVDRYRRKGRDPLVRPKDVTDMIRVSLKSSPAAEDVRRISKDACKLVRASLDAHYGILLETAQVIMRVSGRHTMRANILRGVNIFPRIRRGEAVVLNEMQLRTPTQRKRRTQYNAAKARKARKAVAGATEVAADA